MRRTSQKLTDAQLLQSYMNGDEEAFREIVGRYKNSLYAFLKQFLNRTDLVEDVGRKLDGSFDGSINWYVTTVKLDLEARGVVERIPGKSPQRLRLVEG